MKYKVGDLEEENRVLKIEIQNLRKQLAEKDEKIEWWKQEAKKANTMFGIYRSQIIQNGLEDEETNKIIRHQKLWK